MTASTARGMLLLFAGVALVGGSLVHLHPAGETWAALTSTDHAPVVVRADVPIALTCSVWTENRSAQNSLFVTGSFNRFQGCVHSNQDIDLKGHGNHFARTVRHAGAFVTNDRNHTLALGTVAVAASSYPLPLDLADYQPGGRVAERVAEEGRYHTHRGPVTLDAATLPDGLHFVEGNARVVADNAAARVTVVASGSLRVSATDARLSAYVDGLLFAANGLGAKALQITGEGARLEGTLYAPTGELRFLPTAADLHVAGQVIADSARIQGTSLLFRPVPPLR